MIKVMNDEEKVIISDDIKEKIEYILKNLHSMFYDSKQIENEISISLFYDKIYEIVSIDILELQLDEYDNIKLKSNIDEINKIIEQYNQMLPKENRTYESIYSLNEDSLIKIIDIIYEIYNERYKYFLIRDLINAKNDCIKNMRYFVNENDILRFEKIYDEAIKNKDVEKMKLMLSKVQEATLREWKKYFQNLDNMNDDNFAFIGHSTSSVQFNGDFFSTYISTSLYNQDLTDSFSYCRSNKFYRK